MLMSRGNFFFYREAEERRVGAEECTEEQLRGGRALSPKYPSNRV